MNKYPGSLWRADDILFNGNFMDTTPEGTPFYVRIYYRNEFRKQVIADILAAQRRKRDAQL